MDGLTNYHKPMLAFWPHILVCFINCFLQLTLYKMIHKDHWLKPKSFILSSKIPVLVAW